MRIGDLFSESALPDSEIPNPQSDILSPTGYVISPIGNNMPNWGYFLLVVYLNLANTIIKQYYIGLKKIGKNWDANEKDNIYYFVSQKSHILADNICSIS